VDACYCSCPSELESLYHVYVALFDWQGQKIQGPAAITQKLTSLPFQQCQHRINSLDSQPSLSQGILIFVTGQIMVRADILQQIAHAHPNLQCPKNCLR
jgi:hypothetical protein